MEADLSRAGRTDDLGDTVDYGALARTVERVVSEERHNLLERLAQRIAEEVGGHEGVRAVTVTVRKLRPPVPVDLASAAVCIRRLPPPDARRAVPAGTEETSPKAHGAVGGRSGGEAPRRAAPAGTEETSPKAHGAVGGRSGGEAPRRRAFLGLGSNLGDRRRHLREAVAALADRVAVSPVYETEPVGGPPGQPPYLNLVVELRTDLSPRQLLDLAHGLEAAAGRERRERFGPRTLDVDVLLVGDLVVDEPDLVVPHPRLHERRFVMAPLADLAPELVPADWERRADGEVRRLGTL